METAIKIPLIIKIAESKNTDLLSKFIDQLPELIYKLDREEKSTLLSMIIENDQILNLLDPFYNFTAPKHFDISIYKADLDKFWQDKQNFIQEYKNTHSTLSKDNIYSLLLNAAIVLNNKEIIQYILNFRYSENILTHVDKTNYSPISNVLESGNKEVLDIIKSYIKTHKIIKVKTIDEEDYANISTVIKFPQFEDLDANSCYTDFLKPLYSEDSLKEIHELVGQLSY